MAAQKTTMSEVFGNVIQTQPISKTTPTENAVNLSSTQHLQ